MLDWPTSSLKAALSIPQRHALTCTVLRLVSDAKLHVNGAASAERPEHLVLISIKLALISSFGEQQDCDRVFFGEESGSLHTSLRRCKSSASTE